MTRVKKLIALAGVCVGLSSGVGCGMCDCLTGHDDGSYSSSYTRDVAPPMDLPQQMPQQQMPQTRQPADITTGANVASSPGIYPDMRK
jgi:hypothetical protein